MWSAIWAEIDGGTSLPGPPDPLPAQQGRQDPRLAHLEALDGALSRAAGLPGRRSARSHLHRRSGAPLRRGEGGLGQPLAAAVTDADGFQAGRTFVDLLF